mgnify:FL=1
MIDRVEPNPYSPYATADPTTRHIFAVPIFFPEPRPGGLCPTACDELAVVPEDLLEIEQGQPLPDGLCEPCITAMRNGRPKTPDTADTGRCSLFTRRPDLCALCRQEAHDAWWPTRDATEAAR